MTAQQTNEVSLYGDNAITSGGELTPEELALLEKSQGSGVQVKDGDELIDVDVTDAEAGGTTEETPKETPKDSNPEDAELTKKVAQSQESLTEISKELTAKGVDVDSIMNEFNESGSLTPATYEVLSKAGMSKYVVDSVIAGQVAVANSFANSLLAAAGGESGLSELAQFALTNDPESVDAYNAAVDRRDLATAKSLMKSWKAQLVAKVGTANKQVTGTPSKNASQVQGFQSKQEMVKAMSDKRYGRDAQYTREVELKVGASTVF